jgi:hypothetical protein
MGITYYIGGSVANSIYGMQRAAINIDLVANLSMEHTQPLLEGLEIAYYLDKDMVLDAIQQRTSFSGIHFESMLKIDVFPSTTRPFDQQVHRRAQRHVLAENSRSFYVASPEDVILTQLEGYRRGGQVADDQWNDILGVLKVQGVALDLSYLQYWATLLGINDLLGNAYIDAGLKE